MTATIAGAQPRPASSAPGEAREPGLVAAWQPGSGTGSGTGTADTQDLVERVRQGIIGDGILMPGPYGQRTITYADYTASGRSVDFIEDFIRDAVLPWYANTHTESSGTGLRTHRLREDARQLIHESVGATDDHVVIFCGSGTTGAVVKFLDCMELRLPSGLARRYGLLDAMPPEERPVVFVGPFEHHSNEVPWRESIADVVVIGEDADGHIDIAQLEQELVRYARRQLRIGSFSAASNVTGILSDTDAVSAVLHRHGALSCWDYASAGPHVPIRMAESAPAAGDHKDAVFLSPHKFPGGPQSPGVLVVRRDLLTNAVPTVPGGGTVLFVDPASHRYLNDPVAREEGGTPAIVESIRAGLAFALKDAVGTDEIAAREDRLWHAARQRWSAHPDIQLLGNLDVPRVPTVSFLVRKGDLCLHHNFVVALLNDLFGIQARGGCSCAGPYGHRLLGIDAERSRAFGDVVGAGYVGMKPGWTRVNFSYFFSEATTRYVLDAVDLVASEGHRLLPEYTFSARTGLWRHRDWLAEPPMRLADLKFGSAGIRAPEEDEQVGEAALAGQLESARRLLASREGGLDGGPAGLPPEVERLRWFHLPPSCLADR